MFPYSEEDLCVVDQGLKNIEGVLQLLMIFSYLFATKRTATMSLDGLNVLTNENIVIATTTISVFSPAAAAIRSLSRSFWHQTSSAFLVSHFLHKVHFTEIERSFLVARTWTLLSIIRYRLPSHICVFPRLHRRIRTTLLYGGFEKLKIKLYIVVLE